MQCWLCAHYVVKVNTSLFLERSWLELQHIKNAEKGESLVPTSFLALKCICLLPILSLPVPEITLFLLVQVPDHAPVQARDHPVVTFLCVTLSLSVLIDGVVQSFTMLPLIGGLFISILVTQRNHAIAIVCDRQSVHTSLNS